jgi:hypothetical protein
VIGIPLTNYKQRTTIFTAFLNPKISSNIYIHSFPIHLSSTSQHVLPTHPLRTFSGLERAARRRKQTAFILPASDARDVTELGHFSELRHSYKLSIRDEPKLVDFDIDLGFESGNTAEWEVRVRRGGLHRQRLSINR